MKGVIIVKTEHTLKELGEALIHAHEATQRGYFLNVADLIAVAREIMNYAGYTFDSYRKIKPEE